MAIKFDGTCTAVQCKWRSNKKPLTFGELSTFLFLGRDLDCEYKLNKPILMTNTLKCCKRWLYDKKIKIWNYDILNKSSNIFPNLYPCQKSALYKNKGIVQMACGTGKTIVIIKSIKYYLFKNLNNILISVPSILLIDQFYNNISKYIRNIENIRRIYSTI